MLHVSPIGQVSRSFIGIFRQAVANPQFVWKIAQGANKFADIFQIIRTNYKAIGAGKLLTLNRHVKKQFPTNLNETETMRISGILPFFNTN